MTSNMNGQPRKRLPALALALGLAALYVILLLTSVHIVGTDADLYYREQLKADILQDSGLTDDALQALDSRLARYLKGDASALDAAPFNERELTHMADCFRLFELLRKVRSRLGAWAVLLIVGGAYWLRDRRRIRLCVWLSPLILLIPLGGFAAFALVNFDAAFTFFHRLLFTNDLWLLDPATDLLIRICPESMFMHMGLRILIYSFVGMIAVVALATLLTHIGPKGREENSWKTTTRRAPAHKQITFGKTGMR